MGVSHRTTQMAIGQFLSISSLMCGCASSFANEISDEKLCCYLFDKPGIPANASGKFGKLLTKV